MSRKELYNKVKELGVADLIKSTFGDNFTRVSNANLEDFLRGFEKKTATVKKVTKATTKETKKTKGIGNVIVKLLSILQTKRVITAKEAEEVAKTL